MSNIHTLTDIAVVLNKLPHDLKNQNQWYPCGKPLNHPESTDKAPLTPDGRYRAKWSNIETRQPFPQALSNLQELNTKHGDQYKHLAFVLDKNDPLTCNDWDPKHAGNEDDPSKWWTPEMCAYVTDLINNTNTYIEVSSGGSGVHIWVKGDLYKGGRDSYVRKNGVEIYSKDHVIVCTGVPIESGEMTIDGNGNFNFIYTHSTAIHDIAEGQELIDKIYSDFDLSKNKKIYSPSKNTINLNFPFDFASLYEFEDYDYNFLLNVFFSGAGLERRWLFFNGEPDKYLDTLNDKSRSGVVMCLLTMLCEETQDDELVERCFYRSKYSGDKKYIERGPEFIRKEIISARNFVDSSNRTR